MNHKIQICVSISMESRRPVVIVDAPNVYYDNYCIKHNLRQCSKCQLEMIDLGITRKSSNGKIYADTRDKKWFKRSLEISRLKIIVDFIEKRGYQPLLYCESGMRDYLTSDKVSKRYPDEVPQKRDLLSILAKAGYVIFDEHGNFIVDQKTGEETGLHKFIDLTRGYVSYVRGENPYSFPFRIWPSSHSTEKSSIASDFLGMSYPTFSPTGKPITNNQFIKFTLFK